MAIEIFDLDGTLTEEFAPEIGDQTGYGLTTYSFWNLITRELVVNQSEFDLEAAAWKKMVTTKIEIDKVESSKEMTERGIKLFDQKYQNAAAVRQKAASITKLFFQKGIIIRDAIEYLKYRLSQQVICVISTASYEDGALGFVDGLVDCKLIPQSLSSKIMISGTQIDWSSLRVTHMNVDMNKLLGLERVFNQSMAEIQPRINAVFGDDPAINDRALLDGLCKHGFVIKNAKNAGLSLPTNCVFASWKDILFHRDNLKLLGG